MEKVQQYLLRRFSYLTAALILLVGVLVVAEPADAATPLVLGTATTISSGGQFSTPTNTCAVLVSALGGAGAAGFNGSGPVVAMTGGSGGAGGYLTTLLPLGASQILTVQVGTGGSAATSGGGGAGSPGGGSGYYDSVSQVGGGGGGGESSVTLGSTTEVIASGGGGGASTYQLGPWAGGAGAVGVAGNGSQGAIYAGTAAGGGSQSGGGGGAQAVANGSSGVSNQGGSAGGGPGEAGGGGGAGYFGGGGGGSAGGGGGGSNYVITGALASNGLTFTPPSQSNGEVVLTAEECQSISVGAGPTSPVVGGNYTPLPSATSALPIAEAIDSTTSSNCSIAAGVVSFNAVGSCQVDETQVGSSSWAPATEAFQTFNIGQGTPTTPTIANIPGSVTVGGSFTPTVSTNGDGATSVTDNSTNDCTLSGGVVTFIALGTCSLTAHVANGTNYVGADGSAQTFSIGVQVQKYTILFDSDGGTPIGSISSIAGAPIALPTPTFAQETFDGWYLASSGGEALATPYVPIRSVTLFAQWTPIATVDASVPSAPVIRAISTTAHSIVITLVKAPVSGGAPISGYAYSFGGSWLSIAFNGNHQATIHHLHSGAIVVVSVRATNSIGAGPRSHGIRVKVRS